MATTLLVCLLVGKYFIRCDFKFLAYDGVDFRRPNKNIIRSSFKSSRDIQKKEGGPDSCFR